MIDTYKEDIARAADSRLAPSARELRKMQQAMWARHRLNAWQSGPIGTLAARMVSRGSAARVRRVERAL